MSPYSFRPLSKNSNTLKNLNSSVDIYMIKKTANTLTVRICSFLSSVTLTEGNFSAIAARTSSLLPSGMPFSCMLYPSPYRSFSSWGVPRQRNCPLTRMAIRSQEISASSIECVVRTTALLLCFAMFLIVEESNLRAMGSTPVLGSSKN